MPKKPKTPTITNEQINQLMQDGVIEVVDAFTTPRVIMRGVELTPQYNMQGGRNRLSGSQRWRYTLRFNGARRSILRSTIVWLWHFAIIPPDCEVHHGEAGKDCDALWNLDCMNSADHDDFHYGANCEAF